MAAIRCDRNDKEKLFIKLASRTVGGLFNDSTRQKNFMNNFEKFSFCAELLSIKKFFFFSLLRGWGGGGGGGKSNH